MLLILKKIVRKLYRGCRRIHRNFLQKKYQIISFKDWHKTNTSSFTLIQTNGTTTVYPPTIICENNIKHDLTPVKAHLPDIYLAKLSNVTLIESSDLILADDKTALYDELALDHEGKYEERNTLSQLINFYNKKQKRLGLIYKINTSFALPDKAIHFCKDYSFNYFHWLIEALPRYSILEQYPEYDALPLIVDANLKPQQLEALNFLTQGKRKIIQLEQGNAYKCKELLYPSCLSSVHNNYYYPVDYTKDIVISPDSIHYLRSKFQSLISKIEPNKLIYLSRKNTGANKRLLNDEEIGAYLSERGYQIAYPENMSFSEQIALFSQAKVLIGASGSAFANMIFSPQGCQVFILSTNNKQVNFNLFSTLANVGNLKLSYILGEDKILNDPITHNGFIVHTRLITTAIASANNVESQAVAT